MDGSRFDELTRHLATPRTRRGLLGSIFLGAGVVRGAMGRSAGAKPHPEACRSFCKTAGLRGAALGACLHECAQGAGAGLYVDCGGDPPTSARALPARFASIGSLILVTAAIAPPSARERRRRLWYADLPAATGRLRRSEHDLLCGKRDGQRDLLHGCQLIGGGRGALLRDRAVLLPGRRGLLRRQRLCRSGNR
jgi:hypothetical protein